MKTVIVTTRYASDCFVARAGKGKRAKTASSTSLVTSAVRAAAYKYFRMDESNVQTIDDIEIQRVPGATGSNVGDTFRATLPDLPDTKGGA
jgi:hypothetical protein